MVRSAAAPIGSGGTGPSPLDILAPNWPIRLIVCNISSEVAILEICGLAPTSPTRGKISLEDQFDLLWHGRMADKDMDSQLEDREDRSAASDEDGDNESLDTESPGETWWKEEFLPALRKGPKVTAHQVMRLHLTAGMRLQRELSLKEKLKSAVPNRTVAESLRTKLTLQREVIGRLEAERNAAMEANKHLAQRLEAKAREANNAQSLAESWQADAERIREQLNECQEEKDKLETQYDAVRSAMASGEQERSLAVARSEALAGRLLVSAMAKPPIFDGKGLIVAKGSQQVEDWIRMVRRYTKGLPLSPEDAVKIATSLLQGEAARAWDAHEEDLKFRGVPVTLEEVQTCLLQRFTPAATVFQARVALDNIQLLKDSCKTLGAYVTEFDRLTSLIPNIGMEEKIHRFIMGIKKANVSSTLVQQCCMDPTTGAAFESFSRMRAATLSAAVHSAELITTSLEVLTSGQDRIDTDFPGKKRMRSQHHDSRGRSPAGRGNGSGSSNGNGGRGHGGHGGRGGSAGAGRRSNSRGRDRALDANGAGSSTFRSSAVVEACKKQGRCIKCYEHGHTKPQCTATEYATTMPKPLKDAVDK